MTVNENPKSEGRSPKGCEQWFGDSDFGLLSDFGLRISDLEHLQQTKNSYEKDPRN